MDKLKPCPFCGGKARIEKYVDNVETTWSVNCTDCDIGTVFESNKNDMVRKWNTRKGEEVKDEV